MKKRVIVSAACVAVLCCVCLAALFPSAVGSLFASTSAQPAAADTTAQTTVASTQTAPTETGSTEPAPTEAALAQSTETTENPSAADETNALAADPADEKNGNVTEKEETVVITDEVTSKKTLQEEEETPKSAQTAKRATTADLTAATASSVLKVGTSIQPLWDTTIVDTDKTTARLQIFQPTRQEVVLNFDEPWEGDACDYHSLFWDEELGVYRMYYNGWDYGHYFDNLYDGGDGTSSIVICYAESEDGLTWVKPNLKKYTKWNNGKNNVVMCSEDPQFPAGFDNFFVFKDQNPNCNPTEKYKAVVEIVPHDKVGLSLALCTSPDGYNWTYQGVAFGANEGTFDSLNTCFYSTTDNMYHIYYRAFTNLNDSSSSRIIRTSTSRDFKNWTASRTLSYYDNNYPQLYTNNVQPYYRNPNIYVAFPTRYTDWDDGTGMNGTVAAMTGREFRAARMALGANRFGTVVTDTLFMTSRDGEKFTRYLTAWCTPGPENSLNWLYGDCYFAYGMIQTPSKLHGASDEISMYCIEGKYTNICHDDLDENPDGLYYDRLVRYTSRLDGFAGYTCSYEEAKLSLKTVTTNPIVCGGKSLTINFKTSGAGKLYVDLLSGDGNTVYGTSYAMVGDSTERVVSFPSEIISAYMGKNVRLRFRMQDATIYSFNFSN